MAQYDDVKQLATVAMNQLVDEQSGLVRFSDLLGLDGALRDLGFQLVQREAYGPPGGAQLFYRSGRIVVRVKTKGDEKGYRANQPHLSVSLNDGQGLDWQNDQAKFNAAGKIEPKVMTPADKFRPGNDFQGNPRRFELILGGKYDGPGPDVWAGRTHFQFPPGSVCWGVRKAFRRADFPPASRARP